MILIVKKNSCFHYSLLCCYFCSLVFLPLVLYKMLPTANKANVMLITCHVFCKRPLILLCFCAFFLLIPFYSQFSNIYYSYFLNLPFFPPSLSLFFCTPFWFPFPFTCINSTTWCSSCFFFFSPMFLGIFPGGVDLYGIWLFFFVDSQFDLLARGSYCFTRQHYIHFLVIAALSLPCSPPPSYPESLSQAPHLCREETYSPDDADVPSPGRSN